MQTHRREGPWPLRVQLHGEKMYYEDKLCIPSAALVPLIREHHRAVGHLASSRFWSELNRFYQWPNVAEAKRIALAVPRHCELCQAAEQAHHALKTKVDPILVACRLMESETVDIFKLPAVPWEGGMVDCLALCVD